MSNKGYGIASWRGRALPAHRASYAAFKGDIPDGLFVCHSCDNRPCVNPDHLWLGDAKANSDDAVMKGRVARGEGSGKSKLTEESVRAIRSSPGSLREVARRFSVSPNTVRYVKSLNGWAHVK